MSSDGEPEQAKDYKCYKTVKQGVADDLTDSAAAVDFLHVSHCSLPLFRLYLYYTLSGNKCQ
jgi:hypothetical protein